MAYDLSKVVVTSSPHIKADDDTRSLMLDVLIALVPALAVAVYTFGARALIHVVIAMCLRPFTTKSFITRTP